jgi:hypothetical protein
MNKRQGMFRVLTRESEHPWSYDHGGRNMLIAVMGARQAQECKPESTHAQSCDYRKVKLSKFHSKRLEN